MYPEKTFHIIARKVLVIKERMTLKDLSYSPCLSSLTISWWGGVLTWRIIFLLNFYLWALLPLLCFLLISFSFFFLFSFLITNILLSFFSFSSLPVKINVHSYLGFILVLTPKVSVGLSATSLASWPICTSRFFIAASVLFWCDSVLCMNCTSNSSSLVVLMQSSLGRDQLPEPWARGSKRIGLELLKKARGFS